MPSLATRKEEDPRVLFLCLLVFVCSSATSRSPCSSATRGLQSPVTGPLVSRLSVFVTGLRLRWLILARGRFARFG